MPATKFLEVPFDLKNLDDKGVFEGYGSVFDVVDAVMDRVKKGAFAETLSDHAAKGSLPLMFLNHRFIQQCGEWLEMREDDKGLFCRGKLWIDGPHPDPDALKAYRGMTVKKGKFGLSIGYDLPPGGAAYDNKTGITDLVKIDLWEVSPVVFPANDAARVEGVKSSIRNFERFLRDSGFSRSEATALAAKGFKGLVNQGEPDAELMETARQLIQSMKS